MAVLPGLLRPNLDPTSPAALAYLSALKRLGLAWAEIQKAEPVREAGATLGVFLDQQALHEAGETAQAALEAWCQSTGQGDQAELDALARLQLAEEVRAALGCLPPRSPYRLDEHGCLVRDGPGHDCLQST